MEHPARTAIDLATSPGTGIGTGVGAVTAHLWIPALHDPVSEFVFYGGAVLLFAQLVHLGWRFINWLRP